MNYKKIAIECEKKPDKIIERKLSEIAHLFEEKLNVKDRTIYKVFIKEFSKEKLAGLTILEPGKIGKEFFFTKGHRHKKKRDEIYILIQGNGSLILQNKKSWSVKLQKNKPKIIDGRYAHRLVNTSNKKLKVLTIYHKDSGHNYHVKFRKNLLSRNQN